METLHPDPPGDLKEAPLTIVIGAGPGAPKGGSIGGEYVELFDGQTPLVASIFSSTCHLKN